jgi:sugar phosphate isomerase/epimerase
MADFFHMNIEENNIPESLEKYSRYIKHIHLLDSNQLVPGRGHIDFKSAFNVLKKTSYKNYMALECKIQENPHKELLEGAKFLKSLINTS